MPVHFCLMPVASNKQYPLLVSTMEKKFFYFGIRVKESSVSATGAPRQREVALFAPKEYGSAAEACAAAAAAMQTRLGVSFFVQGYDKPLDIDSTGHCKGFKA